MNTTAQPAQATQAEVTDKQIKEAATKAVKERNLSWVWFEKDDQDKYTIPILSESHYQLVRAGLALRPERVPMTERELELIDGMITVQLGHAQRCDAISNRDMAEKQKGWDMERVELLRRIRSLGITAHAQKGTNGEIN